MVATEERMVSPKKIKKYPETFSVEALVGSIPWPGNAKNDVESHDEKVATGSDGVDDG